MTTPETEHIIDCDAAPFVPDDWTVEEHKKGGMLDLDKTKIELYLSRRQRRSEFVEGNKLRKELQDKPVLNANVLDYLLKHPFLIPEKWKGETVFFWGTIYNCIRGGDYLCVRGLWWVGDRWDWRRRWLGEGCSFPAAVSAS